MPIWFDLERPNLIQEHMGRGMCLGVSHAFIPQGWGPALPEVFGEVKDCIHLETYITH